VRVRVLFAVIAGVIVFAAAGCGSGSQPTKGGGDPNKADGGKHGHDSAIGPWPVISPAKMYGGNVFAPGRLMSPNTSGWEATSHTETTNVEAGADARHKSTGLFFILRSFALRPHHPQTSDIVSVAGSGPVTITKAPLGRKVVVSAQKHGNIEFTSKSGITGTLHLKDDTVTLNR